MNAAALFRVLVALLAVVAISACTRSLEMTYNPAAYQLPEPNQSRSVARRDATQCDTFSSRRTAKATLSRFMRR